MSTLKKFPTTKAKVLLGWLTQTDAVTFLCTRCYWPKPLSVDAATEMWRSFHEKVRSLKDRKWQKAASIELTEEEKVGVLRLGEVVKRYGVSLNYGATLKLDPADLVIHQFLVLSERAGNYSSLCQDGIDRIEKCLGLDPSPQPKIKHLSNGKRVVVKLPHFEYVLLPMPNGTLDIRERIRGIAIVDLGDRFLLWGGYHRSYAVLSQMTPDAAGPAPLLTLISGTSDLEAFLRGKDRPDVRDLALGKKPAFLRDFLNPDLFIEVDLRLQRMEVRGDFRTGNWSMVRVDEE